MSFNQKENQTLQEGDIFNLHKTPFDKEEYEPVEIKDESEDYFVLESEKLDEIWIKKENLVEFIGESFVSFTGNFRSTNKYKQIIKILFDE